MSIPKLIAIVGPTASGKTALAIEAAEQVGGEIICADSRTVYKGMDIGTAKPNAEERAAVPHHLLDVVEPNETYTAARFKRDAEAAIEDISVRGKTPLLVGGTGLYVDSVLFDYQFGEPADAERRSELEAKTIEELQEICERKGIEFPVNIRNKRHLIRAIEQGGINRDKTELRSNTLVIGLCYDREVLRKRVQLRADKMFAQGVAKEATNLAKKYGLDAEAMSASIYRILRQMLEGKITEERAKELFVSSDMKLTKRQMTWFKRNKAIEWFDESDEALRRIQEFVTK